MRQSPDPAASRSIAVAAWDAPTPLLKLRWAGSSDFWDVLTRVAAGAFFASLAASYFSAAIGSFPALDARPLGLHSLEWLSIAAIGAFYTTVTLLIVVRAAPLAKARGFFPRLAAVMGSYVLGAYAFFPRNAELPPLLQLVSAMLIVAGTIDAVWVLCWLGRSFSVMAEARQLVTSGPYRFVRHPLYLAELISTLGIFIAFASPWTGVVVLVQFGAQIRRMLNEEQVLGAAFPDYAAYAARTRRLIPGVW
jgi:protein-S-isoprenylcysteine O-methyltransferase Ste14